MTAAATSADVPSGDRPQVVQRRVPEEGAPEPDQQSRFPSDASLELPPAGAHQVVADVRFARVRRMFGDLPSAFDRLQRDAHLRLAGRFRDLFDRMPVPIAAGEVHARIHRGRVALQDLLDEADALEEFAPVEGRDQAETADQVGHERLLARLMPRLGANRVLDRLAARAQRGIELASEIGGGRMFPRALQQPDHERGMDLRRPALPIGAGVSSASTSRSASSRWARLVARMSPRVRRCSTSASFSAEGHAHSSPMVKGVTDWNAVTKRCTRCASSRPALNRINSSAIA